MKKIQQFQWTAVSILVLINFLVFASSFYGNSGKSFVFLLTILTSIILLLSIFSKQKNDSKSADSDLISFRNKTKNSSGNEIH
jgi:hypothetical protein